MKDLNKIRYKRYIDQTGIIYNYNENEAFGFNLFKSLINSGYFIYSCYCYNKYDILVITNESIICINSITLLLLLLLLVNKHKIKWNFNLALTADEIVEENSEIRFLFRVFF